MRQRRLNGMRLGAVVCGSQLVLGVLIAALFGWLHGLRTAEAALWGAVIAAVPGFYMALHILPRRRSDDMRRKARLLVFGQLGKLVLTGGLFVAAILVFERNLGPLLITYAACLLCYWPALMITR